MIKLSEQEGHKVYIRNEHDEWEWRDLMPKSRVSEDERKMIAITVMAVVLLFGIAFGLVWRFVS